MKSALRVISFAALVWLPVLWSNAFGHEMFLKADSLQVSPNSPVTLTLMNGTFDKSENVISRDRMHKVSITGNDVTLSPDPKDWTDVDNTSFLHFHVGEAGTYAASVVTHQKVLEKSAEMFRNYLSDYGFEGFSDPFDNDAGLETVKERYSKNATAVMQVGGVYSSDVATTSEYPLRVILKSNPYQLKLNDEITFQVLFKGNPVVNQFVKVGYAGQHGHDASGDHDHSSAYELRTDQNGIARFLITSKAVWYMHVIHLEKVNDVDADYESNWTTLAFEMK